MLVFLLLVLSVATAVWLWRGRLLKDAWWSAGWVVLSAAVAALAVIVLADRDKVLLKTIGALAMPTGLFWLLLLGVATARWAAGRWWSGLRWTLLALAYTAIGNVWVGDWLLAGLEARVGPIAAPTVVESLDAVVVLGGGTAMSADGAAQLGTAGDRVAVGAELWLAGKAPVLVCTGGAIAGLDQPRDYAQETRTLWRALGVADAAIVPLSTPENTREEIAAVHALSAARGWRRVGLVTSAWHLPRALGHCRRAGLEVVPIAADRVCGYEPAAFCWLVPNDRGFRRVHQACWELLALATGR